MKKLLETVMSYAGITLAGTLIGVIGGVVVAAQEVTPYTYQSFVEVWPKLDKDLKDEISAAMADGRISRWESTDLYRRLFDAQHALLVRPSLDVSLDESRTKLKELIEAAK